MRTDPPREYAHTDPLGIHAWYVGHISHRKVPFQKIPPPMEKSLKRHCKISNKVVYVYCVSEAVGQTNTR
jgi:L-amino acid N-acyltransferase YncA